MKLSGEGKLLRVFVGESDRLDGKPLFEKILLAAKEEGLAGVTVLRGIAGFGARSRIHTAKVLRLSEDLPVVLEIVDTEDRINKFMTNVDVMFERSGCGGLITLERAEVIRYTHGS
ncbi:MAG TPA: DUF190 domain-containing protein [Bacteroidota bacterium]|jgi:hypothetical protein